MAANINSAEGRIGGSAVAAKVNFGGHSAAGKLTQQGRGALRCTYGPYWASGGAHAEACQGRAVVETGLSDSGAWGVLVPRLWGGKQRMSAIRQNRRRGGEAEGGRGPRPQAESRGGTALAGLRS